jgi:hypothetical protein
LYSIHNLQYCTLSHILSLLFQFVRYHTLYPYSSIMYTILHYIATIPYCTLSYIPCLLVHTVHCLTFYP